MVRKLGKVVINFAHTKGKGGGDRQNHAVVGVALAVVFCHFDLMRNAGVCLVKGDFCGAAKNAAFLAAFPCFAFEDVGEVFCRVCVRVADFHLLRIFRKGIIRT